MVFLAFLMQSHFGIMSDKYDLINWQTKETLQTNIELSKNEVYDANQMFTLNQIPQRYVKKHIQTYTKHISYYNIKQILYNIDYNK
jgi:hypothetical protein